MTNHRMPDILASASHSGMTIHTMAAWLEALAQYYKQHGFSREAGELQQKAKEYRLRGMPDEFPRESSVVSQRNIRFSSSGRPLDLEEDFANAFRTKPIEVPQVGDVVLQGYRGIEFNKPPEGLIGVTIRKGKMIERKYESIAKKEDMLELEIEVDEGPETAQLPPGHKMFCRLEVNGFDKAFETELDDVEYGEPYSTRTHINWGSADPEDANSYAFFVSPEDTNLLNSLSFSFYSKPRASDSS